MKYQRILLISKNEISSWESCKRITNNLASGYMKALEGSHIETLLVPEDLSLYKAFQDALIIKEKGFDLIIWVDHKPNAAIMLEALEAAFHLEKFENKPKFLIHLFGDFVLDCLGWKSAEAALKNYPVHFVTASERQKNLVDSFFVSETSICSVQPFSVDKNIFNVDHLVDNRKIYREKYEASDDFVILYTGRISYQKNVDKLIKIFESLNTISIRKMQLWIAGPWDDIFLPYAGINGVAGSYFSQFSSSFPEGIGKNVKFIGELDSTELSKLYHAADLFVSLSTFNDEDFGMSVAEALSSGLPCLLSDWGGFANFKKYSNAVDLVKVDLTIDGPVCSAEMARKTLMKILLTEENNLEKRIKISTESLKWLSSFETKDYDFNRVKHLSPLFLEMCLSFSRNSIAPFEHHSSKYTELYREIYKNYVS